MKKRLWYKKTILIGLVLILLLVGVLGRRCFAENPLEKQRSFVSPSYVSTGSDGTMVVVDKSKTRVSLINPQGEVIATINGGVRSDRNFYYAEYACTDGRKIYICDVLYTSIGTEVMAERIFQYDLSGRFERIVFEQTYSDGEMPLQKGYLSSVRADGGELNFLLGKPEMLGLYRAAPEGAELIRSLSTVHVPYRHFSVYDPVSRTISLSDKRGLLYTEKKGTLVQIKDWSESRGERVYWELASTGDGQLYAADPATRQVVRISDERPLIPAELAQENRILYRLSGNEKGILSFTDNRTVFQMTTKGEILFSGTQVPFATSYFINRLAVWLCGGSGALMVCLGAIWLLVRIFRTSQSHLKRTTILLEVAIILTSVVVTSTLLGSAHQRLRNKDVATLKRTVSSISGTSGQTFGDALWRIDTLSDYAGPDHATIRKYLDVYCAAASENGSNLYYILFKASNGLVYGVVDYEDTTGTIYPHSPYKDSGFDRVMEEGAVVMIESQADSYGFWTYAQAPVYNSSGQIVGILEIGSDLNSDRMLNQNQVQGIVISTAVLLLIILLMVTEGTAVAECLSQYSQAKEEGGGRPHIPEFIRPLSFLIFFADNASAAFIPQLSEQMLLASGLGISATLGAALPMSAQLFCIALMAFLGGYFTDRMGTKRVLLFGIVIQFAGYLMVAWSVAANGYLLLLFGKIIGGCGQGLSVVSINTLPTLTWDEERKNNLFSGLNVGLMSGVVVGTSIGSQIAEAAGYAVTFLVSAAVMVLAWFMGWATLSGKVAKPALTGAQAEAKAQEMSTYDFLRSKSVFSFLLLLMFPFLVLMYFKDYVFPLLASSAGHSDSTIGNILLLGGALSIYLEPVLSRVTLKYLKAKGSIVLASLLYIAALWIFAFRPNMTTSVIAVLILSVAGCFGLVNLGIYYSSMPVSLAFGSGKSMGVYSLFDNLGQTAGPLLFGAMLILGYGPACFYIGGAALVLLLAFLLFNRPGKKQSVWKGRRGKWRSTVQDKPAL
ncbi:MFS transporter (plasmid) [Oscillospiraceae bacterium MB08-C2-2]|nr:MFS transporter [Oscillospiraceae bacterium MB08-C2-2]